MDIRPLYKAGKPERDRFVEEAQRIADLTIPEIEPKPSGQIDSVYAGQGTIVRQGPPVLKRPFSDVGATAVKTFAGVLSSTLYPTNVRPFRLISDPLLNLSPQDEAAESEIFSRQEERMEQFFNQYNFSAFSVKAMRHLLIEGNIGVKIDAYKSQDLGPYGSNMFDGKGFLFYPLRSFIVKRHYGVISYIIFKEIIFERKKNEQGNIVEVENCQYVFVDKISNKVWVQKEDDDNAKLTDEYASQYYVATCEVPTNDNYGRSYYADQYPTLNSINVAREAVLEAIAFCAWNWASYTGSTNTSVAALSKIKRREIVRLESHEDFKWQTAGGKIPEWQWVAQMAQEMEQRLLQMSAFGISNRAAQITTATEVNAIRAELESLTGPAVQTISQEFYAQAFEAVVDILEIRNSIKQGFEAKGITLPDAVIKKLVQVIVITGTPALAREQDAQKMLIGIQQIIQTFGPNALQFIHPDEVIKSYLDGLQINTVDVLKTKDEIAADQQAQQQAQIQQAQLLQQIKQTPPAPQQLPPGFSQQGGQP